MRRLTTSLLIGLLLAGSALAQDTDRTARMQCVLRALDAWVDITLLMQVGHLNLTAAQLQALAALYEQHPPGEPDLAVVQEAADKLEAFRRDMLAGGAQKPADQEALGKLIQTAFAEFNPGADADKAAELTPEEKLVWGLLTPEQQGKLIGGADPAAMERRALSVLKQLRALDQAAWPEKRDRLANLLAAGAGAEGTPARANALQMCLDFLNRVRDMTDAEFAQKQKELGAEAVTLVPQGANLSAILLEFDPSALHQSLRGTLLNPRTPRLLREMQAARAKPAGGQ
ncbi:MAG: hypothetical protein KKI08_23500 [Armatimonadetes bacterium]|nr:hypothetical protein [Armatimonadota bacterium]